MIFRVQTLTGKPWFWPAVFCTATCIGVLNFAAYVSAKHTDEMTLKQVRAAQYAHEAQATVLGCTWRGATWGGVLLCELDNGRIIQCDTIGCVTERKVR